MSEIVDPATKCRHPVAQRPYPSWGEILAKLDRDRTDQRTMSAPASREWRDAVADMIVGRR